MKLVLNQKVRAKVSEVQRDRSLIVSFSGSLLRVENQSNVNFKEGDVVELIVVATKPLRFRLSVQRSSNGFRVSI